MAAGLPYFKFQPGEWFAGRIAKCSMEAQGLFINICAYYWKKRGNICLADVAGLFEDQETEIRELLKRRVIKLKKGTLVEHLVIYREGEEEEEEEKEKEEKENPLTILFLDKQLLERGLIQKKRIEAGKKSGMKRRQNREDVLSKKVKTFEKLVQPHSDKYPPEMIADFISYWTETKPNGLLLRWEMQAAFDVAKRLGTWNRKEKEYQRPVKKQNTVGSRSPGSARKTYRKSKEL
jgi:hypothetical protein